MTRGGKIDLKSSNLTRPGFGGIIKRDRLKSVESPSEARSKLQTSTKRTEREEAAKTDPKSKRGKF